MLSIKKITTALLFIIITSPAAGAEKLSGTLGPIRLLSDTLPAKAKGEAQRALRSTLKKSFSGQGEALYMLKVIVENESSGYQRKGAITGSNIQTASWEIKIELIQIKPEEKPILSARFPIVAQVKNSSLTFDDPSKHFPEYLAERSRIALNEFVGIDQEKEKEKLAQRMQKERGFHPISSTADVFAEGSIAFANGVRDAASDIGDAASDPSVISALHSGITAASPTDQSVDEIFSDNHQAINAIVADKAAPTISNPAGSSQNPQAEMPSTKASPRTTGAIPPKSVNESHLCRHFRNAAGIDGYMNVNGRQVPYTTNVSPSPAGKYWYASKAYGDSSITLEIRSGGQVIKREGGEQYEYQWGVLVNTRGEIECPGGAAVLAFRFSNGRIDHHRMYIHENGRLCIGGNWHCRR